MLRVKPYVAGVTVFLKEHQQTKLHATGKILKKLPYIPHQVGFPPKKMGAPFTDRRFDDSLHPNLSERSRTCDVRKSPGHFDGDGGHSDHHPELLESRGNLNLEFLQDGPLLVINGD